MVNNRQFFQRMLRVVIAISSIITYAMGLALSFHEQIDTALNRQDSALIIFVVGVFFTIVLVVLQEAGTPSRKIVEQLESLQVEFLDDMLSGLSEKLLNSNRDGQSKKRACIYLKTGFLLYTMRPFSTYPKLSPDENIAYRKNEGLPGRVLATSRNADANWHGISLETKHQQYKLNDRQLDAMGDVQTALCVPMFHPHRRNRLIGALAIYTNEPPAEANIETEDARKSIRLVAAAVAKILHP